jgi:hypothetical protein
MIWTVVYKVPLSHSLMPDRSLEEIGLGSSARSVIYAISALPFVGFVIGGNYMMRRSTETRRLGRRLMIYAVGVHLVYTFCVCPVAALWATA